MVGQDGLVWLEECESTNALGLSHLDDPTVRGVGADRQTAGRGRRGRAWSSPPGGLYFTWLARPRFEPQLGGALPLLAGIAVADLCESFAVPAALKWPNDVLVGGRKVAGILCEARPLRDGGWGAAVGIGLNLRTPPGGWPAEVPGVALDIAGLPPGPRATAIALCARLEFWVDRVARDGLGPVVSAWEARGPSHGIELRRGETVGRYLGLAPDGALRLDTATGEVHIHAGDVEEVR